MPTLTTCHPEPWHRNQLWSCGLVEPRRGICSAALKGHVNRVKRNCVEERPFMPVRQSFPNRALALACLTACRAIPHRRDAQRRYVRRERRSGFQPGLSPKGETKHAPEVRLHTEGDKCWVRWRKTTLPCAAGPRATRR